MLSNPGFSYKTVELCSKRMNNDGRIIGKENKLISERDFMFFGNNFEKKKNIDVFQQICFELKEIQGQIRGFSHPDCSKTKSISISSKRTSSKVLQSQVDFNPNYRSDQVILL